MNSAKAYVEHVAIKVRDIHWHSKFFHDVCGMTMREVQGSVDDPEQYWTLGGMQFIASPDVDGPDGCLGHVGVMCEDLEATLAAATAFGVTQMPQGRNWLRLPDGLVVEFIQASPGAVAQALAVNPRAQPKADTMHPERYWDDAQVGDECVSPTYTVTAARILAYADLTGDHTPVHVDEDYARNSHFGGIVAHGLFGLSIADGLKTQSDYRFLPGMSLGWTWDFLGPIRADDELHVKFKVASMRESKSKPGWGIVVLASELINQHGNVVQKGEHRLMIPRRPA